MMTGQNLSQYRVSFITLGCAKNEVDSTHMSERLRFFGFTIVDDPSKADVVVVNTCSFIQAATEESLEVIFDLFELPLLSNGSAKLIVAGCMPARYGEELEEALPEAGAFVPCSKEDDIVEVLCTTLGLNLPFFSSVALTCDARSSIKQDPFAYVKISDGCDRFCAFCTIPFIRGRYHSFTQEKIFDEVSARVATGVREIVLIAQDTGRWGTDFENPTTLSCLLEALALRYPQIWFRVMYIQPEGISDDLLRVIADHDNVCSYLDIPLQHSDPEILKAMNRKGSAAEFQELIAHIRKMIPGVVLRTTFITGFPGESEEALDSLADFVEESAFDYVGVFPYSQEEGTRAALLPAQHSEEVKLERAQRIRDIADETSIPLISARIGKEYDVLVLGTEEDGQLFGRAQCQAPDVDGVTYLEHGKVGQVLRVTISDTLLYEMEGL